MLQVDRRSVSIFDGNYGSSEYRDALPPAAKGPVGWRSGVAALVLAFVLAALLLAPFVLLGPGPVPQDDAHLVAKVEMARKGGSLYDVAVVGTSRVASGLDPRAAERGASDQGCRLRFVNLGLGGMTWAEALMMGHAIGSASSKPALVIQEAALFLPGGIGGTARSRWRETPMTLGINLEALYRWGKSHRGFRLTAMSLLNALPTGYLARFVAPILVPESDIQNAQANGGFDGLNAQTTRSTHFRVRFLASFSGRDLAESVSRIRNSFEPVTKQDLARAEFATRFSNRFSNSVGAPVLGLIPPAINIAELRSAHISAAHDSKAPYLTYLPDRAPELYNSVDRWFDDSHLETSGAELFSIRLGRDVCKFLSGRAK